MSAKSLETWSWVLIYGGLLLLCLGIFVARGDAGFGYALCAVAVVLVAAGIVLIARRARLPEPRPPTTTRKE